MPYNILIVDDSDTVRAVIAKTLSMAGLDLGEVHTAANGQEGLDLLREHWVDLVLTDINMPVMNGVEMIERMEADDALSQVPVVVVSTEGSTRRMDELKAKGVRAYLRKPFTPEKLKETIEELLGGGT